MKHFAVFVATLFVVVSTFGQAGRAFLIPQTDRIPTDRPRIGTESELWFCTSTSTLYKWDRWLGYWMASADVTVISGDLPPRYNPGLGDHIAINGQNQFFRWDNFYMRWDSAGTPSGGGGSGGGIPQTINLEGDQLSISDGNTVDLSAFNFFGPDHTIGDGNTATLAGSVYFDGQNVNRGNVFDVKVGSNSLGGNHLVLEAGDDGFSGLYYELGDLSNGFRADRNGINISAVGDGPGDITITSRGKTILGSDRGVSINGALAIPSLAVADMINSDQSNFAPPGLTEKFNIYVEAGEPGYRIFGLGDAEGFDDGTIKAIYNVGGIGSGKFFTIVANSEHPIRRFFCSRDIDVYPGEAVIVRYDDAYSLWRVISAPYHSADTTGGGSGGGGDTLNFEPYNHITTESPTIQLESGPVDNLIDPSRDQASVTYLLPISPVDGQICSLTLSRNVTGMTVSTDSLITVQGGPSSSSVERFTHLSYKYYAVISTWIRTK